MARATAERASKMIQGSWRSDLFRVDKCDLVVKQSCDDRRYHRDNPSPAECEKIEIDRRVSLGALA
jgi:hypothetical protein